METMFKYFKKLIVRIIQGCLLLLAMFFLLSDYSENVINYKCVAQMNNSFEEIKIIKNMEDIVKAEHYYHQSRFSSVNKLLKPLYLELHEYQWWVGLWSDSKGSIKIESSVFLDYYSNLQKGKSDTFLEDDYYYISKSEAFVPVGIFSKTTEVMSLVDQNNQITAHCSKVGN